MPDHHSPTIRIKLVDDLDEKHDFLSRVVHTAAKCVDEKELLVECRHGEASFFCPETSDMVWLFEADDGDLKGLVMEGKDLHDVETIPKDLDVYLAASRLLKFIMVIC